MKRILKIEKVKQCKFCKEDFVPKNPAQIYCSDECKKESKFKVKNCEFCRKEFKTKRKTTRFCSAYCRSMVVNTTEEYREIMSNSLKSSQKVKEGRVRQAETMKEVHRRPGYKENQSLKISKAKNCPESKEKTSKSSKEVWQRDDFKEKMIIIRNEQWTPELRKARGILTKNSWQNLDYLEKMEKRNKENLERFKNDEWRNYFCQQVSKACNTQEKKDLQSIIATSLWQIPEYVEKVMNSSSQFKDFVMPSGKMVKLQGYEPKVLTELLKTYPEEDILTQNEIIRYLGPILYIGIDGKEHSYRPDFYIKSENKIVEVKGKRWYIMHEETCKLKEKACLKMGLNYEIIIL